MARDGTPRATSRQQAVLRTRIYSPSDLDVPPNRDDRRDALAHALANTNRYRAGYSPYLDQLDADRNPLATELILVQTRADRVTAVVSLYRAPVGGWLAAN